MSALNDYCRAAYGEAVEEQFGVTYDEMLEALGKVTRDA
jgi:hypothetical protein